MVSKMIKKILTAGVFSIVAASASAQTAPVDFGALLDQCNSSPAACQAILSQAIATIQAQPGLAPEVVNQYMSTVATVAASAAQSNGQIAGQMAEVVQAAADVVAETDPEVAEQLAEVSGQVADGTEVDLDAIAGSPS